MNYDDYTEEVQNEEKKLLKELAEFINEKKHPNISVNKNTAKVDVIPAPVFYYPNRINKMEMFWEKNTFDFLLEIVKQNHNMKQKIEIVNLFLSVGFWEHEGDSNPYNVMHSILLAYNIIKV